MDEPQTHAEMESTAPVIPDDGTTVSDEQFEQIVRNALEPNDGVMLFKMRIGTQEEGEHVAAAAIADGDQQHFVLISLSTAGGELTVEPAAESSNPLARIAASYAGLAEAFAAAA